MKRLITLLVIMLPLSLGCDSINPTVETHCEGIPIVITGKMTASLSGYYKIEASDGVIYLPVQKCILIQKEK